ncbi:hypothetical protein ARMGADRAFT_1032117 [Armillaria gallica]|uniref:Uncharacterized protein n=1 Tax=Armillaria gallica TaxID=47427 RepID=A0A2H3DB73_ARMGA|nr:hypothetical protein ARMGADRAFT_1032117 [Armillaria gallica]
MHMFQCHGTPVFQHDSNLFQYCKPEAFQHSPSGPSMLLMISIDKTFLETTHYVVEQMLVAIFALLPLVSVVTMLLPHGQLEPRGPPINIGNIPPHLLFEFDWVIEEYDVLGQILAQIWPTYMVPVQIRP